MDETHGNSGYRSGAEELFADWLAAEDESHRVPFEELLAQHKVHAAELKDMHSDWQLFAPILDRVVPNDLASSSRFDTAGSWTEPDEEVTHQLMGQLNLEVPDGARYRFRGVLGRGGGGVVLWVWDKKLKRSLAMKIVLGRAEVRELGDTPQLDAATMTRFVDEARIASQLDHPGIVPVHELGTDEQGRAFFTMRLVNGEDLSKIFERVQSGDSSWSQVRVLGLLVRACDAVAHAHEKGVIHRDLKPANIMVGRHGDVNVMDWGLARVLGAPAMERPAGWSDIMTVRAAERNSSPDSPMLTQAGSVIGTPMYMAPEQALGAVEEVDARSDVYAMGAILYELLAGDAPFTTGAKDESPFDVLRRVIEGPPPSLHSLAPAAPPSLVAICERAMSRDRAARYRDVGELSADLSAYLEQRVVRAYASGPWAEAKSWMSRNPVLATTGAAFLLSLLGSTWIFVDRARIAEQETAAQKVAGLKLYQSAVSAASMKLAAKEIWETRRTLDTVPDELRGWEWTYLSAASDQCDGVVESPYTWSVDGVRFVRNGRAFVTSNFSQALGDGTGIRSMSYDAADIMAHRQTEDGGLLSLNLESTTHYTRPDDGAVTAWDLETMAPIFDLADGEPWGWIVNVSTDGAGSTVITTDLSDRAKVWSTVDGQRRAALGGHDGPVRAAALSSDGRLAVTAGADGVAIVWDVASAAEIVRFDGHAGALHDVVFDEDGSHVLSCSDDGTARLWDARSAREVMQVGAGVDAVVGSGLNCDGNAIFTRDAAGHVRLWRTEDQALMFEFDGLRNRDAACQSSCARQAVFFSPDGAYLAIAADVPVLVEVLTGEQLTSWNEVEETPLAFMGDSGAVLTSSGDGVLYIRSVREALELRSLTGHDNRPQSASVDPGGRKIVSSAFGELRSWDPAQGRSIVYLTDQEASGADRLRVDFTKEICVASGDITGYRPGDIYDLSTGELLGRLGREPLEIDVAEIHPTKPLVYDVSSTSLRTWDADLGLQVDELTVSAEGEVDDIVLIENGETAILFCSAYYTYRIEAWDLEKRALTWSCDLDAQATCVTELVGSGLVSVATEDGRLEVRSSLTGEVSKVLVEAGSPVLCAAYDRGRHSLYTGHEDHALRCWGLDKQGPPKVHEGHTKTVMALAVEPRSERVFSSAMDGTVRVWDRSSDTELLRIPMEGVLRDGIFIAPDGSGVLVAARAEVGIGLHWLAGGESPLAPPARSTTIGSRAARDVAERLSAGATMEAMADSIRQDSSMPISEQRAYLRALAREARSVQDRVRETIAQCPMHREAMERIREDMGANDGRLEMAQRLMDGQDEYYWALAQFAWKIASSKDEPGEEEADLAMQAVHKSLELEPTDEAFRARGALYYRLGQDDEAIEALSTAHFDDRELHLERLAFLSLALWRSWRREEAEVVRLAIDEYSQEDLTDEGRAWVEKAKAMK